MKNIPCIRFKGFSGEWEEKKFEDVISDLYNGQTPSRIVDSYWNGKINWLSSGELNRSIVTKTIEKISVSGQKNANLRIVPSGTFVMAITGLEATGTRGNCAILGIDTTLNQSCMAIYPNLNLLHTHFLFQWYRKYSEEYGIKFTQGTKQQSYNAAIIRKLDITLPKVAEQTEIGNYFQHLDKLIEQKEKKYQKLRQFKKAMLDKMFPKNGDATPEIRFKGFSGEWEEKEFNKSFTNISNNTLSRAELNYNFGLAKNIHYGDVLIKFGELLDTKKDEIPFISNNDFVNKFKSAKLQNGDVIIADAAEDEIVGKCTEIFNIGREIVFSGLHTIAIRPILPFASKYLGYYMNSPSYHNQLLPLLQGTKVLSISKSAIKNTEICSPKDFLEQTKIGNYFQHLDKLIDLHLQELEKLKNIKKASLEKMFV